MIVEVVLLLRRPTIGIPLTLVVTVVWFGRVTQRRIARRRRRRTAMR
jgi:hypothetical protein